MELRRSGIDIVGDIPWGTHFCHFYETKDDLLDILIPYFKAGLENNEFCLWIISPPRSEEEMRRALRQAIPGVDQRLAAGDIEILPHERWYLSDGSFDLHRLMARWREKFAQALAKGYAGMRMNGNEAWLTKEEWKDFSVYEEKLDNFMADQRVIILCTYCTSLLPATAVFDVTRTHQFAIARRYGKWEVMESPELQQTKAELKKLNEELELRIIERTNELTASNQELIREVSERKEAEEELRQSERDLAESQRMARLGSWRFDITANIVNWSEQLFHIFDVDKTAFDSSYEFFISHVHPDDKSLVLDTNRRARESEEPFEVEYRIVTKAGQLKHIREIGYAMKDAGGKVVGLFGTAQDITERKRMEEELKQSEQVLRSVIDNLAIGISLISPKMEILMLNRQMLQWFPGIDLSKKLFCYSAFNVPPREEICSYCPTCKTLMDGDVHESITESPAGNEIRNYRIISSPIRDKDGNITAAIEVVEDITERKRAEQALHESEALFKNAFASSPIGMALVAPNGLWLKVNPALCKIVGYSVEELLTKTFQDITHVDDLAADEFYVRQMLAGEISTYQMEKRYLHRQGQVVWVLLSVSLVRDKTEQPLFFISQILDVTERKLAEEELRKKEKKYKDLFDSTLGGIYQMDADGVFILMNPAGAKMFGYDSPNEIIGRRDLEYWRDPRDRNVFRAELKIKKSVSGYHMRLKTKSGEPIEIETSSTIKEDEKGVFLGMEGILRDITEHKKLEDQLRHAQKMEAVGTLAGGIAHDFNNILNVIIGYGNMVMDSMQTDSPSKGLMNEVLAAAEKATNLTKRLLVFSRKQLADVKPTNINDLITDIRKMLGRIIGEDIDFKLDLADSCLIVMGDAGQIEQVLMNLVSNAKDAMPEGGRLSISTGIQEFDDEYVAANGYGEPGKYVFITIADTGHGMDAETQKNIFEPFFTTKGIGEGTGLGLAISYGIIKQHRGYIKVYSEPGQGTAFKIYLPLIEESTCPGKKMEAPDSVRGGNETILVAEDDDSLRKLTRIVLESLGYTVITAEDGEDAITKFMENRERIKLVLLDMIMPKKNGKEVSEVIRKVSPRIKVLFASGYTMDIIKNKELTELGFDFIHKPVSSKDLLKKVREILDK